MPMTKSFLFWLALAMAPLVAGCAAIMPAAPQPVASNPVPTDARDSGWAVPRNPNDPGLVEAGRQIAMIGCASCHAIDLTSASPRRAAMPLREMLDSHDAEMLAQKFIGGAGVGHAEMPVVTLNGLAADALVAYLKTLQTDAKQRTSPPAQARP